MPIHLKIKPKDLSTVVLLSGDPDRTKIVAEKFLTSVKIINDFRGLLAYTGKFKNVPVSVVTTGIGCPSAVIVLEELVSLGAKILIRIGTCGGVQKKIKPGDLIIPDSAIPLVGLLKSYQLNLRRTPPEIALMKNLIEKAKDFPPRTWVGPICTSDAFYQEKKEAKEWKSKGILAMEMECAGLFALAKLRKVKAGAILTATDNILYGRQVMESKEIKKAINTMCKIALETILSLQ